MLRCTTCDHPEILVTTECEPGRQQQAVAGPVQISTDTAAAAGGTATGHYDGYLMVTALMEPSPQGRKICKMQNWKSQIKTYFTHFQFVSNLYNDNKNVIDSTSFLFNFGCLYS